MKLPKRPKTSDEARAIMADLKAKLAAGEITWEQFDAARQPVRDAIVQGTLK